MNNKPSISVIMAVHNGSLHLCEAIDSILNQTFKDFEFIIINDASTDKSPAILSQYNDQRIKIIHNQENIGLTKSLNKGLAVAQGEYIARMDADDISLPNRLEIQKKFLDEHPEIIVAGSATIIIDSDGNEKGSKKPVNNPDLLKFYILLKNQITHSSVMFRRNNIVENGSYNESIVYAQDYDLWSRLLLNGLSFTNIEQPLLKYRFHSNSITQGSTKEKAYESAKATVYKNINHYITLSKKDFEIFIESFHKHSIQSLYKAFIAQKILGDFTKSYLKKESPSADIRKKILIYTRKERINSFKWYAMYRFRLPYKIMKKIKNII